MKVSLVTARFINNDLAHNLSQVEKYMRLAKEEGAELVCFGEAFLQGFDAMNWEYAHDKDVAITLDSPDFQKLLSLSEDIQVDLMIGFLEKEGEKLYSSCALICAGKLFHRYRRISQGWKEYTLTDGHYCEGCEVTPFLYRGRKCLITVCGDLWEYPEKFKPGEDLLFWAVFLNYPMEEWKNGIEQEYADQAGDVCKETLLFDSLCDEENVFGGCCHFIDKKTVHALETGEEGLLTLEI